jgi:oxygen-dependent protoporphyrinogen oxidase
LTRAAVVGAGVTGLAAAWHLDRVGVETVVFDAAGRVGGRVSSAEFSGRQVDTGPDALGPDPAIDELLAGIGLAEEIEIPDPPQAFRLTAAGVLEPFGVGGGAMFGLTEGIFSLPARLEQVLREAGANFRLGSAVEGVTERDGLVSVRAGGGEETFDAVVVATGARRAAKLVGEPSALQLDRIEGISVTLVHLAFPKERIGREMNGTGYLADPAEGRLVTGCSWSSAKWRRLAGDPAILRASVREDGRGEVIELPDEEVVAKVLKELRPVMELEGEPVETMITRHPEALVVRDESHESAVAAARASLANSPRIGLAGADLDGPGISRSIAGVRKTVDSIIEGIRND